MSEKREAVMDDEHSDDNNSDMTYIRRLVRKWNIQMRQMWILDTADRMAQGVSAYRKEQLIIPDSMI